MFIAKWRNLKCSDSQHTSDAQSSFVLSYLFTYFIIGYTGSSLLCVGFLFAESGGYSLILVCGLLIARTSLVVEHRL